jgi:hypothetical protein
MKSFYTLSPKVRPKINKYFINSIMNYNQIHSLHTPVCVKGPK